MTTEEWENCPYDGAELDRETFGDDLAGRSSCPDCGRQWNDDGLHDRIVFGLGDKYGKLYVDLFVKTGLDRPLRNMYLVVWVLSAFLYLGSLAGVAATVAWAVFISNSPYRPDRDSNVAETLFGIPFYTIPPAVFIYVEIGVGEAVSEVTDVVAAVASSPMEAAVIVGVPILLFVTLRTPLALVHEYTHIAAFKLFGYSPVMDIHWSRLFGVVPIISMGEVYPSPYATYIPAKHNIVISLSQLVVSAPTIYAIVYQDWLFSVFQAEWMNYTVLMFMLVVVFHTIPSSGDIEMISGLDRDLSDVYRSLKRGHAAAEGVSV